MDVSQNRYDDAVEEEMDMEGGEHLQMDGVSPGPHDESGMSPEEPHHQEMQEQDPHQHQQMMSEEEYKQAQEEELYIQQQQ